MFQDEKARPARESDTLDSMADWGGKREGAGRKQVIAKRILFGARTEDLEALQAHIDRTGATQSDALRYACDLLAKHERRKAAE